MSYYYKRCPNGHFYKEFFSRCPFCKLFGLDDNGNVDPDVAIKEPNEKEVKVKAPLCPNCGKPIRTMIRIPRFPIVGSLNNAYDGNVPWNYDWDGKCEQCGHDFSISVRQILPNIVKENSDKWTIIRPDSRVVEDPIVDSITMVSGVEIETELKGENERLFLSTNELKYLLDAFKDSPFLAQLDWSEDYT